MRPCSARAKARLSRFTTNSRAAKFMNNSMTSRDCTIRMKLVATARHPSISLSTLANLNRAPAGNDDVLRRRLCRYRRPSWPTPAWFVAVPENSTPRRESSVSPATSSSSPTPGTAKDMRGTSKDDAIPVVDNKARRPPGELRIPSSSPTPLGPFKSPRASSSFTEPLPSMTMMAAGVLSRLFIATMRSTPLNTATSMAHPWAMRIRALTPMAAPNTFLGASTSTRLPNSSAYTDDWNAKSRMA
mmetsp:Transcript_1280/g.3210  ORF Transcript_1280/g.3210 Transcript_1280/m.3210 type:complete len:244 (-) Transcript_1280:1332-2063(-)